MTWAGLGTNHFKAKLRVAMHVTTNYDGDFVVSIPLGAGEAAANTFNLLRPGTPPSTTYTLGGNGVEYGYIVETKEINHYWVSIPDSNDALIAAFGPTASSTVGGIWIREVLVIVRTCAVGCAKCSRIPTDCSGCTVASGVNYYLPLAGHACGTTCPAGEAKGTGVDLYTCVACHSDCNTCSGALNTQCTSCLASSTLYLQPASATCAGTCPSGSYIFISMGLGSCQPCAAGCAVCTGGTR